MTMAGSMAATVHFQRVERLEKSKTLRYNHGALRTLLVTMILSQTVFRYRISLRAGVSDSLQDKNPLHCQHLEP